MTELNRSQIESALGNVIDPYLKIDLVSAQAVKNIAVEAGTVTVDVVLGYPARGVQNSLIERIREALAPIAGVNRVEVALSWDIVTHAVQQGVKPLPQVKNIVAVASGKGGVGKSTVAVNLALALSTEGAQVGILDADIYGPSQPRMLAINERPKSRDGKTMEPLENHGIQSMSIGYLIDEEAPMIWRGPMVTGALEQLLNETNWRDLDYLIIDLPPGTGDTQLTLAQKIPVSGAVIVTTPQDIALLDARKGLKMFEKVNVPVLGVVENMSTYICSQCGHEEHIFGHGGGERLAAQYGVEYLGALPLDIKIREQADGGRPSVIADPDGAVSLIYRDIARKVAAALALRAKDYSARFPEIVIQNN